MPSLQLLRLHVDLGQMRLIVSSLCFLHDLICFLEFRLNFLQLEEFLSRQLPCLDFERIRIEISGTSRSLQARPGPFRKGRKVYGSVKEVKAYFLIYPYA